MYCDQCEQAFRGSACLDFGVCGKNPDIDSLQKILLYGVKGMAAYKHHARRLGKTDSESDAFVEDALFATLTNVSFDTQSLLEMILECGRQNLRVMQMLNDGHVEKLGKPSPVEVAEGVQDGPGILVTGHDMIDLKDLLEQSAGANVKVYTHGEMLPAHMYPELRKHAHLAGNFGGAWQDQRTDFERFGGPILATTNCVVIPRPENTYGGRLHTSRMVSVPGGARVKGNDFSPLIRQAQEIGPLKATETRKTMTGFHYTAILDLADAVVAAVKEGRIRHFFVIGGCDGFETSRGYFSDFARNTPADSLILTLGCGKYRLRCNDYGTVRLNGTEVPRLLDMGQCNDAYGAIQVALALAKVLQCGVNDLPLTLLISWFEQKAVAILLTLLHLGVKSIRLGPALPAFVTPNVLQVLQESFDLRPMGNNAAADVEAALAGK